MEMHAPMRADGNSSERARSSRMVDTANLNQVPAATCLVVTLSELPPMIRIHTAAGLLAYGGLIFSIASNITGEMGDSIVRDDQGCKASSTPGEIYPSGMQVGGKNCIDARLKLIGKV